MLLVMVLVPLTGVYTWGAKEKRIYMRDLSDGK